jgi:hypothetical protein
MKILLLAYKYPPYNLVGANRWKNISQEIAKSGVEVNVLTTFWGNDKSIKPISKNLKIHRVSTWYPNKLKYLAIKSKLIHYARQSLFKFIIDPFCLNASRDEASQWCKASYNKAKEIILNGEVTHIIATGAPFSVNTFAAELKSEFPSIKLVQDYRDRWSKNYYDPNSKNYKKLELKTLEAADGIVSVTKELLTEFIDTYPQTKASRTIENGYDSKIINIVKNSPTEPQLYSQSIITLTHIGNVSNGREEPLKELLKSIINNKLEKKIRIKLIGDNNRNTEKLIHLFPNINIETYCRMPQVNALKIVKNSTFALQLNSPQASALVSTKIYEYAGINTPVLSINYGSLIEELVIENELGLSINIDKDDIDEKIKDILNFNFENFSSTQNNYFSFSYKAKEYVEFLKSI